MQRPLTKEDLGLGDLGTSEIDVLDLPQIHTRPSARVLIDTLDLLRNESRSWESTPPRTPGRQTPRQASGISTPLRPNRKVRPEGVPQYLTKIVSSDLRWIASDSEKERIWDVASIRLSERSGRSARGAFTRTFAVPKKTDSTAGDHDESPESGTAEQDSMGQIDISIHEPALTADNLGLKTWAASYVLARNWHMLAEALPSLSTCLLRTGGQHAMLELGAGTGLVGIAAAAMLGVNIILSDLPEISSNLARNARANEELVAASGGRTKVVVLDWSNPESVLEVDVDEAQTSADLQASRSSKLSSKNLESPLIVAADPIYSKNHPALLVNAIGYHLSHDAGATVIIALPIRDAYAEERADLRQRLGDIGLQLSMEMNEIGLDDWGDDDEPSEVVCNITIWRRPSKE